MRPTERLGALAILTLSLLLAALRPAGAPAGLAALGVALAATVALARLAGEGGPLGLVRDVAPFAVAVAIFSLLQPAIEAVNPARYDALFGGLDRRWLGGLVRAWRGALGRPDPLTDAAYLAYVSFYLLPVVVLVAVRARRARGTFDRASFTIVLGFYLSYAGYFCWPTSGPRLPRSEEALLGGGIVSQAIRDFLRAAEATTLDGFPSGHAAISLLAAHVGARFFPRAAWPLFAWAAAVVFAAVYVQAHYAVDVLAGALLYGLTLGLAPRVLRCLGGGSVAR
jgi:membrane-associated phospholipid phosphatase